MAEPDGGLFRVASAVDVEVRDEHQKFVFAGILCAEKADIEAVRAFGGGVCRRGE